MDKVEVSDILNDETEFQNIKNITQGYVNSSSKALQQLEQTGFGTLKDLKNDFKDVFVPHEQQLRFLRAIFNPKVGSTLEEWTKLTTTSEEQLKFWWNTPGFSTWITQEAERRMLLFKLEWLAIGIKKMHNNVESWKTMKELFFPDGVTTTPSEKGSKRQKLEAEVKRLIQTKQNATN